jgi:hypothetical protein
VRSRLASLLSSIIAHPARLQPGARDATNFA